MTPSRQPDVRGSAFGNFAALVQHNDFIESFFDSFANGPNIIQPRNGFDAGQGRRGVPPVFTDGQAHRFAMFGETRGVNNEIHLRILFVALPEADAVIDQINTSATFRDLVRANHLVEMDTHFRRRVGHGETRDRGVFFEAPPVAFVGEGLATRDSQRGEDAPATDETGLTGRKTSFLDRQQRVVVKDVRVNHSSIPLISIVTESRAGMAALSRGREERSAATVPGHGFLNSKDRQIRRHT